MNDKPVDRANENSQGIGYECRFEKNGWRLPTVEEIKNANFDYTDFDGFEWTTDVGEYGEETRTRIRINEELAATQGITQFYTSDYDPEEKYSFRLCRGIKENDPKDIPEDLIV